MSEPIELKKPKNIWKDHTVWWSKMIRDTFAVIVLVGIAIYLIHIRQIDAAMWLLGLLITGGALSLPKAKKDSNDSNSNPPQ